ncbi:hypothetical protein EVAR_83925_1 [Eumeta japonica]|uniref:Uncharacterized protein n=1 Tax=Eumeta variegata TaxID=151549 RepID=A0A4C1XVG7_EUMVA|nr:hypothetical protein EVAR_83925_1 [Eumeta japonica]
MVWEPLVRPAARVRHRLARFVCFDSQIECGFAIDFYFYVIRPPDALENTNIQPTSTRHLVVRHHLEAPSFLQLFLEETSFPIIVTTCVIITQPLQEHDESSLPGVRKDFGACSRSGGEGIDCEPVREACTASSTILQSDIETLCA